MIILNNIMTYHYLSIIFLLFGFVSWSQAESGQEMLEQQATEVSAVLSEIAADTETDTAEPSSTTASNLPKDIILVLDNSGSMKKNDPQFLAKYAVKTFINNLDESARVSIVIFDEDVHVVVPLTEISSSSRQGLLESLTKIDYKGLHTNSPAAIEKSIYELKNNAREEAKKVIIFMTDGIVDTGNADRDIEQTRWLREDLGADAADARIRIFGIAFTEDADFELIQSLAQNTDGEYYRVLLADDLQQVFDKLITLVNDPDEPEEPAQSVVVERIIERIIEPLSTFPDTEISAAVSRLADDSERKRSMLTLVALAALILAVVMMVFVLLRGSKSKPRNAEIVQEAYLNDIHNVTGQASFMLGSKPTMLGRIAGKDTEFLNYLVIPETTIGRRHALIEYKDFSYWIIDQGSINRTSVNGKAVSSEVRLKHGDIIQLHNVKFGFVMPEMADTGETIIASQDTSSVEAEILTSDTSLLSESSDDTELPSEDSNFDVTGTVFDDPEGSDETTMLDDNDSDGNDREDIKEDYDGSDDATIHPNESSKQD